jgi:hypothetical protein
MESYLEILISAFLHLTFEPWNTAGDGFASLSAILLVACGLTLPIFTTVLLVRNQSRINQGEVLFKNRFDSLFSELRTESTLALMYHPIFLLRRLLFVVTTHFLTSSPMLQVNFLFLQCLAMVSYLLKARPFAHPTLNRLEVFNELAILTVTYPTLVFTGYLDSGSEF